MTKASLFRRLRGAFKIAVVWGVGWFVGAFIVSNALRFLGVVPASLTWVDSLGMAIKIGLVGGIAGGAFSTLIAFRYRGKRLKEINWVRFGILGGVATGIFIPGMMETLSILSGGGVVPLNLILDDIVLTTVFGTILAGGSMKLAQYAERRAPGSIGDSDQMEWLGSGEVLGDQLAETEARVKEKAPYLMSLCLLVVAPAIAAAQTGTDSAAALTGVREFTLACHSDTGRLWGRPLCGPLITVDGGTRLAVASEAPPEGRFDRQGALWIGQVPEGMQVANSAFEWKNRLWSTVRLPLPTDRYTRIRLLMHEAFHRIQPDLGLNARDAINAHLDERDGRYLLRLELHAMTAALRSSGGAARRATQDALIFRAQRNRLYPGSDSLETSLEIQEGLAEYTGTRLALEATGLSSARVAQATADFENRPSYVRALGYGTGPLLGLLLDRYAPGWRTRIRSAGFSRQLAPAIGFVAPVDLAGAVAANAPHYGGDSLARIEDERAMVRARAVAEFRSRLVDGPVIILQADQMFRSFDPNNLVPLGLNGTVYPTGTFQAEWGVLTVEHGGALVAPGNREVRVPVPAGVDSTAAMIEEGGWRLELKPGWRLRQGPRPGDFTVARVLP